jgi:hypothetical protein
MQLPFHIEPHAGQLPHLVGSTVPQVAQFLLQVRQVDPLWSQINGAAHDMHSVAEGPVQVAQEALQFAQAPVLVL